MFFRSLSLSLPVSREKIKLLIFSSLPLFVFSFGDLENKEKTEVEESSRAESAVGSILLRDRKSLSHPQIKIFSFIALEMIFREKMNTPLPVGGTAA